MKEALCLHFFRVDILLMKQALTEEWGIHCFLKDLYKLFLNFKFADPYNFFSKDMYFCVVVGLLS